MLSLYSLANSSYENLLRLKMNWADGSVYLTDIWGLRKCIRWAHFAIKSWPSSHDASVFFYSLILCTLWPFQLPLNWSYNTFWANSPTHPAVTDLLLTLEMVTTTISMWLKRSRSLKKRILCTRGRGTPNLFQFLKAWKIPRLPSNREGRTE